MGKSTRDRDPGFAIRSLVITAFGCMGTIVLVIALIIIAYLLHLRISIT